MKEKIKIGIIIEETIVEHWIYRILDKLFKADFAEIVVIFKAGRQNQIHEKSPSGIFRFHEAFDSWLYRGRYDYNSLIDSSALIKRTRVMFFDQPETVLRNSNEMDATKTFDGNEPDLLLNFSQQAVSGQVLKLAKYGVLTFKVEGQCCPGSPATAYFSLVDGKPEIECYITLTTDGAPETVVCRSSVSIFSNSIHINRNRVLGLAELLMPRVVERFYLMDERIMTKLRERASINSSADLQCINSTSSIDALRNLIKLQTHSLKKKALYLDNENWFLLYKNNGNFDPLAGRYDDFLKLEAPNGSYWADPFVVYEMGRFYLFVEEYFYKTGLGHLAVLKPDQEGHYQQSEVILKKPYHLSYPFVFKHDVEYFMIPETKSEKVIQIYRCTDFPDRWEFVTNIMENVAAADTTVFYYHNKWWLFTSIDTLNNADISFSELFLFHTDDLFSGRWESHPQNPIVSNISQSRPAGRIFEHDGMIIRPSQDSSGGYGKAVNLNQIVKLNDTEYEEKLVTRIAPDWDSKLAGMHTFNSANGFYILDACKLRRRFGG